MLKDRIVKLEGKANQSGNCHHLMPDYSSLTDSELDGSIYKFIADHTAAGSGVGVSDLPGFDKRTFMTARYLAGVEAEERLDKLPKVPDSSGITRLSERELDRELTHFLQELPGLRK